MTALLVVALGGAPLAGCATPAAGPPPTATPSTAAAPSVATSVKSPPTTGTFDYQLDEPYPPGQGVSVVVRDRSATAPPDRYGVCYLNAFQTQPQDRGDWLTDHPELVLRTAAGTPVEDPGWPGELLLDLRTDGRREAAAAILAEQLATCVAHGFAAVELDNLDSWTRSGGRLTRGDAAAYAGLLVDAAHAKGLAVAQKNATELLDDPASPAFDFAVTEDCGQFDECSDYLDRYGARVFDIEYTDAGFGSACAKSPPLRVVRRDLELAAPGAPGHVLRWCAP